MRINNPHSALPRRGIRNSKEHQFPSWEEVKGLVIGLMFVTALGQSHFSFSQEEENWRVIPSLTDWVEEINNWPDSLYEQPRLEIQIDLEKDSGLFSSDVDILDSLAKTAISPVRIKRQVRLWRVKFNYGKNANYNVVLLGNLLFEKDFELYFLENNRFGFFNTTFEGIYQPRLMETRFGYWHQNCHFKKKVNINNPSHVTPFSFIDCRFERSASFSANNATPSIYLKGCQFFLLDISDKASFIQIDSCSFDLGIGLYKMNVENSVEISDSEIGGLFIQGAELPTANTYIPFEMVQNKLGLVWGREFWSLFDYDLSDRSSTAQLDSLIYRGNSNEELAYEKGFDQLISTYYKLLNIYKASGQMEDYNACYIEMRDKQTRRSRLLYDKDPSFNRYFDYQINRFTRAFSDYGTRPAKAIVIFFQVVLGFSVFYFFFPSTWNSTNSRKLMRRLTYLGSYFKSKEGLSDLFEKETKDQYRDYEEFKSFMSSSEKELPVYFQWLSKPLYHASVSRFNLSRNVLRRTDVLNGKWAELPPGRKAGTSFVIGVSLLFYLLYVLAVRCLNAITLSLNAFSTLGFGEIPTRGIARYVTIIQGFVGWFLLSIFLVSLIGQILN